MAQHGTQVRDLHVSSGERYRAFFEHAADAVVIADAAGHVVDANRRACELLGYSRDTLLTLDIEDLVPDHAAESHGHLRERYQRHPRPRLMGSTLDGELYARRADGSVVAVDISLSPLPLGDQQLFAASIRDVTEHRHHVHRLSSLAFTDEVTGLANRAAVIAALEQMVTSHPVHLTGIAFLDLDHFKPVNDEFGHAVGDDLLQSVGERIGAVVRRDDLVARYGGDEFVVLIRTATADPTAARRLVAATAERVRAVCAEPFRLGSITAYVSASIGVTLADFVEDEVDDPQHRADELLRRADAAQYEAKRRGRDRVVCAWDLTSDDLVDDPTT